MRKGFFNHNCVHQSPQGCGGRVCVCVWRGGVGAGVGARGWGGGGWVVRAVCNSTLRHTAHYFSWEVMSAGKLAVTRLMFQALHGETSQNARESRGPCHQTWWQLRALLLHLGRGTVHTLKYEPLFLHKQPHNQWVTYSSQNIVPYLHSCSFSSAIQLSLPDKKWRASAGHNMPSSRFLTHTRSAGWPRHKLGPTP